jgi:cytoskeletal protein CcmA (bactofilin family)
MTGGLEMDKQQLPDLLLTGVTGGVGGHYNKVSLDGVCKVKGAVRAGTVQVNGMITFLGDVDSEALQANGKLKINGSLEGGRIDADGLVTISRGLRGESCSLNGVLNVEGSCELEELKGEGVFEVKGLLSAGHVNFTLLGQAKAGEIGVESLVIRRGDGSIWNKLAASVIPKLRTELITKVIEGDVLDLEYTTAEVVRGDIVKIGQGCSIGRVEYLSELKVHPDATVGKAEKNGE